MQLASCAVLLLGVGAVSYKQAANTMGALDSVLKSGPCPECPPPWDVANAMRADPQNRDLQLKGCYLLTLGVESSDKRAQDKAASVGVLEAAVAALRNFPDDKEMLVVCAHAIGRVTIFNRDNGLRAGRLGGLNLTIAGYRKWMEDPKITSLGGDIGCYLDWCNENRAILRELGGVQLLIQNIKNNFHGQYSDWAYEPVKNSLFGLSSGCWLNQDICVKEGFVELAVQLMDEHTAESKIAEETLQVVNALIKSSDKYRRTLADAGLANSLVNVLRKNPTDRGAVSLACHTLSTFVGPARMTDPIGDNPVTKPFDPKLQALATKAGAVEELIQKVMGRTAMEHHDHAAFNFDVDEAYNAQADCLEGLSAMARDSPSNQRAILAAGLVTDLASRLPWGGLPGRAKGAACSLIRLLASSGGAFLAKTSVPVACHA